MDKKDFKIGKKFYTGSGCWYCVDKGTKCIIAVKEDEAISIINFLSNYSIKNEKDFKSYLISSSDQMKEEIFYWYDWGGCRLKPFDLEDINF